jgi:hypothetical protein
MWKLPLAFDTPTRTACIDSWCMFVGHGNSLVSCCCATIELIPDVPLHECHLPAADVVIGL